MSLTVTEGATGTYTPSEAGTFTARCISLIDLGTQTTTYEGQTKQAHKLLLQFEVTDPDNCRDDGAPHVVSKRFTASLHPKAALRGFLEAWRGRPFTPEELRAFDLQALLGAPCLLGIVHAEKEGRTFANIASVMKLPKGMTAPAGELDLVRFDLDAPDWQTFAALPQRLQEQIAASPEYARAKPPQSVAMTAPASAPASPPASAPAPATAAAAAVPVAAAAGSGFDDMDDDIPF